MLRFKATWVNKTENSMIGQDPEFEETEETRGELFRTLRAEYGRCTGPMYREYPDGDRKVGWVFEGRDTYSRSDETYVRETWIEVIDPSKAKEKGKFPKATDGELLSEAHRRGLI